MKQKQWISVRVVTRWRLIIIFFRVHRPSYPGPCFLCMLCDAFPNSAWLSYKLFIAVIRMSTMTLAMWSNNEAHFSACYKSNLCVQDCWRSQLNVIWNFVSWNRLFLLTQCITQHIWKALDFWRFSEFCGFFSSSKHTQASILAWSSPKSGDSELLDKHWRFGRVQWWSSCLYIHVRCNPW